MTFKHGLKWTLTDVNDSSSIKIMRNRPKYNSVYGQFKRSQYPEISRRSSVNVSSGCDEHTCSEKHKHNHNAGVKMAFATIGAFMNHTPGGTILLYEAHSTSSSGHYHMSALFTRRHRMHICAYVCVNNGNVFDWHWHPSAKYKAFNSIWDDLAFFTLVHNLCALQISYLLIN